MKVFYMNGAGNDFMVIDGRCSEHDYSQLAPKLCAITNADGFMAVDNSSVADFKLHFYNSDGSRGEMCGNGARCICRFANEIGLAGDEMQIETDAGIVFGWRLDKQQYRVRLNNPGVLDLSRKGDIAYVELGMPGVPHAVREYEGDLWSDADLLKGEMRNLRYDPAFPKGANVNYYSWIHENEVRVLTFERGVEDFTLACGTGCGSISSVLKIKGLLPDGKLTLHNRGGVLRVEVCGDQCIDSLFLEGPTEIVQTYDVDI